VARERLTLAARSRTVRRPVPLAAALVALLAFAGCAPVGGSTATEIAASAPGISVSVTPAGNRDADPALDAALVSSAAVLPGAYLMLLPSDIATAETVPVGGVALSVTLPIELPSAAIARFAYFDEVVGTWTAVASARVGRQVTATVDHLSLWSVIISGPVEVVQAMAEGLVDAGQVVSGALDAYGEAFADGAVALSEDVNALIDGWYLDGPGAWMYRQAGLVLSIAAQQPVCEDGPLPEWVDGLGYALNEGIADENQSLLWCAGPAPDDPDRVEIRAAVNRGYGLQVTFADGVRPSDLRWSQLEDLTALDLDALAQAFATMTDASPFLGPRELLIGTTELSFTVSEGEARAVPDGQHLVAFSRPDELQMAMSVVTKLVMGLVEDATSGAIGAALALRNCRFDDFPQGGVPAAWAGWIVTCLQEVSDRQFQESIVGIVDAGSESGPDWSPALRRLWTEDGTKSLRKVLRALKWVDVLTLVLPMIDYAGERPEQQYVDVIPLPSVEPTWEDVDGTWCRTVDPSTCITIQGQRDVTFDAPLAFMEMRNGCFFGTETPADGGGANVLYCPAGLLTPGAGFTYGELSEPDGDNDEFDRIWFYNGIGPSTFFRQGEVAAATG
jgi:hypothetical protein